MDQANSVKNLDEIEWLEELSPDGTARRYRKKLAEAAGARNLGASVYRVEPGARPWPRHYHFANEESIYILSGSGSIRIGETHRPLRTGDYIALPAGGEHAHQIINDSSEDLVFLCLSTMVQPDICVYPDSGKIGVFAGAAPGGPNAESELKAFLPLAAQVPYWDGEP